MPGRYDCEAVSASDVFRGLRRRTQVAEVVVVVMGARRKQDWPVLGAPLLASGCRPRRGCSRFLQTFVATAELAPKRRLRAHLFAVHR